MKKNTNIKAALITLLIIAAIAALGCIIVLFPLQSLFVFAGLNVMTVVIVLFIVVKHILKSK